MSDLPDTLSRMDIQRYSWMDDGFIIRVVIPMDEHVPLDQVRAHNQQMSTAATQDEANYAFFPSALKCKKANIAPELPDEAALDSVPVLCSCLLQMVFDPQCWDV